MILTGTEETNKVAKFLINLHVQKLERKVGVQQTHSVANSRRSSIVVEHPAIEGLRIGGRSDTRFARATDTFAMMRR